MSRSIENLYIWQLSRNIVNDIYYLMKDCKDYGFKDQIQRAAINIMNNIAEVFDSGSDKKFISYLNISRGSCSEVNSMLYLCEDFKICNKEERISLQNKIKIISSGCIKMIKSLSYKKMQKHFASLCLCVFMSLSENLYHQQPYCYRDYRRYQSWHHEGVVKNIFADFCCTCSVEVDCCNHCRIIRYEEISVYRWEQRNQKHRIQSEGNAEWHDSAYSSSLTIKEN